MPPVPIQKRTIIPFPRKSHANMPTENTIPTPIRYEAPEIFIMPPPSLSLAWRDIVEPKNASAFAETCDDERKSEIFTSLG